MDGWIMYRRSCLDYARATRTINALGTRFFLQAMCFFLNGLCVSTKFCGSEHQPLGD
jgi:hypothetical protein